MSAAEEGQLQKAEPEVLDEETQLRESPVQQTRSTDECDLWSTGLLVVSPSDQSLSPRTSVSSVLQMYFGSCCKIMQILLLNLLVCLPFICQGKFLLNNRFRRDDDEFVFGPDETDDCKTPEGNPGLCSLITDCPVLYKLIQDPAIRPFTLTYLKKSICGYVVDVDAKVCCPNNIPANFSQSFTPRPTQPPTPAPTTVPPTFASVTTIPPAHVQIPSPDAPKKIIAPQTSRPATSRPLTSRPLTSRPVSKANVLPATCGLSNVTRTHHRIVGGEISDAGAWPWATLLGYRDSATGTVDFACGGALITNQHIVTAAHCVYGRPELALVRLGEHELDNKITGVDPQDIEIEKRTVHESYNRTTYQNDIAILKLKRKVNFTNGIQPICLPIDPEIQSRDFVKSLPFTVGWGTTSFKGETSNVLREIQVPVVTEQKCKEAFKSFRNVAIDNRVICAGYAKGGKDTCQGDSGGPLMLPTSPNTDRFFLLGVVSLGYKCAEPGYYGVYTRTTSYVDWITSNLI